MNYTSTTPVVIVVFLLSTASATVWYIHPDSTLNSIQTGMNLCSNGDTVLVGAGTYFENINFYGMAITVQSEYGPDTTTIDGGSLSHPDTGSVVLFISGEDSNSVLNGFTITHGTGTVYPPLVVGGGIFCLNNSCPIISDNTIIENTSTYSGGGIACYAYASPIIRNNIITDNTSETGGGIIVGFNSSPIIENNTVVTNTASLRGGGIACGYNCSLNIISNTIADNTAWAQGGGLFIGEGCSVTVTGNTITGNTAVACGGGIITAINSVATITDNSIINNTGYNGGGIDISYNSSANVTNNTVTLNSAIEYGGGIFVGWNSTATISNNDIIDNLAPYGGGIACYDNCSPTITRNTITGNTALNYGSGIWCSVASSPSIDSCTISANSGGGVCCASGAIPEIHYSNITSNIGYGVQNLDPSTIANVQNNWWGDATGPYHPTTNPSGLGDSVSDYVDYDPWLTSPGVEEHRTVAPIILNLQVAPNPFADETQIRYMIHDPRYAIHEPKLSVYDAGGRWVKHFNHKSCIMHHGSTIRWDGTDHANRHLPAGTYFIVLHADKYTAVEKVLLIR
ncbi:hypothetical protein AMJ83_00475 [candidate division WOR_3 bacterium SM23_42]|uniref:Right handed beta helix domain-containing protein n=1 Tax=candidate division WOR_3 bacterium SM23_42 TaxID=1703779 RepID=A0A0S8FVJ6_UNCW3|nr:MAG: hypothetical protein AMJ83_00475 [candidate division WOR_3 bacterium SM23_42]